MRGGTSLSAGEPHERSGIRDIIHDLRNNFSRPRNERGPPRSGVRARMPSENAEGYRFHPRNNNAVRRRARVRKTGVNSRLLRVKLWFRSNWFRVIRSARLTRPKPGNHPHEHNEKEDGETTRPSGSRRPGGGPHFLRSDGATSWRCHNRCVLNLPSSSSSRYHKVCRRLRLRGDTLENTSKLDGPRHSTLGLLAHVVTSWYGCRHASPGEVRVRQPHGPTDRVAMLSLYKIGKVPGGQARLEGNTTKARPANLGGGQADQPNRVNAPVGRRSPPVTHPPEISSR